MSRSWLIGTVAGAGGVSRLTRTARQRQAMKKTNAATNQTRRGSVWIRRQRLFMQISPFPTRAWLESDRERNETRPQPGSESRAPGALPIKPPLDKRGRPSTSGCQRLAAKIQRNYNTASRSGTNRVGEHLVQGERKAAKRPAKLADLAVGGVATLVGRLHAEAVRHAIGEIRGLGGNARREREQ